jgi:hypothetical protein
LVSIFTPTDSHGQISLLVPCRTNAKGHVITKSYLGKGLCAFMRGRPAFFGLISTRAVCLNSSIWSPLVGLAIGDRISAHAVHINIAGFDRIAPPSPRMMLSSFRILTRTPADHGTRRAAG